MRKGFSSLFLALCAMGVGVGISLKPWKVYLQQKRATEIQVAEMKKVQAQHISDLQLDARISSSVGREELARQLGYHKPDEVAADK